MLNFNDKEEYENKQEIQDLILQDHIKDLINNFGNYETWSQIEKTPNPIERAYYRKIFFMVGGKLDN